LDGNSPWTPGAATNSKAVGGTQPNDIAGNPSRFIA
jgi:hypothetical protein